MVLLFYNKGMLEKVTKQRLNSAQLSYFFGAKRVQLNAEISLFLKNHSLEFLAHGSWHFFLQSENAFDLGGITR